MKKASQSKAVLRGFLFSQHQCADHRAANSRIITSTLADFARAEERARRADWRDRE
jgi:hypothetical protein